MYYGVEVGSAVAPVGASMPGIFYIDNSDGSRNSPSNPAQPGDYVSVYGTGGGAMSPPGVTGNSWPLAPLSSLSQSVSAAVGGEAAGVLYAGSAPALDSGFFQINVRLPADLTPTAQFLSLTVGGVTSMPVAIAVPGAPPTGPAVGGVVPAQSSTMSQTYTFTFTDSNGFGDLAVVDILINNSLSGIGACYVAVVPTGTVSGYLSLVDDADDGGYAGSSLICSFLSTILSNGQCAINTVDVTASASGSTLTLHMPITFMSSFAGNRIIYMSASNRGTGNSGWQAAGSVTVP